MYILHVNGMIHDLHTIIRIAPISTTIWQYIIVKCVVGLGGMTVLYSNTVIC